MDLNLSQELYEEDKDFVQALCPTDKLLVLVTRLKVHYSALSDVPKSRKLDIFRELHSMYIGVVNGQCNGDHVEEEEDGDSTDRGPEVDSDGFDFTRMAPSGRLGDFEDELDDGDEPDENDIEDASDDDGPDTEPYEEEEEEEPEAEPESKTDEPEAEAVAVEANASS